MDWSGLHLRGDLVKRKVLLALAWGLLAVGAALYLLGVPWAVFVLVASVVPATFVRHEVKP